MRTFRLISIVALLAVFPFACDRSFDAPPPPPVEPDPVLVSDFEPPAGFLDTKVLIIGEQFEPVAEDNIVYFGTETAQILSGNDTGTELVVLVPNLEIDARVNIKVSTSKGQAASVDLFAYRGPGHPLEESLRQSFKLESLPVALAPVPSADATLYGAHHVIVVNAASHSVSVLDLWTNRRTLVGLEDPPLSCAAAPTSSMQVSGFFSHSIQGSNAQDGDFSTIDFTVWHDEYSVSLTPGESNPKGNILEDAIGDYPNPEKGFVPGLVKAFPMDNYSWQVAVGDRFRPLVVLSDPSWTQPRSFWLGAQDSLCGTPSGGITDMIEDGEDGILVTLDNRPEVMRIDLDDSSVEVIWPPDMTPSIQQAFDILQQNPREFLDNRLSEHLPEGGICAYRFGAMARSHDAVDGSPLLFLADKLSNRIYEFNRTTLLVGIANIPWTIFAPSSWISSPSKVYSLTVARKATSQIMDRERYVLYAATEQGLLDIGILGNRGMYERGFWPLAGNFGGSQALLSMPFVDDLGNVEDYDQVLFADSNRERLLLFTPESGPALARELPVGPMMPELASSCLDDSLYVADEHSNTIKLINPSSGLQIGQFLLGDSMDDTGRTNFTCMEVDGADVIVAAVPNEEASPRFRGVQVQLLQDEATRAAMINRSPTEERDDVFSVEMNNDGYFDEMLPAPVSHRLLLVRLGRMADDTPASDGFLWTTMLSTDEETNMIIEPDEDHEGIYAGWSYSAILPSDVSAVRLASGENALALLADEGNNRRIDILDMYTDNQTKHSIALDSLLSQALDDFALHSGRAQSQPTTTQDEVLYLAFSERGHVLAIPLPASNLDNAHVIQTGGAPSKLVFSPDTKRLYVLHRTAAKVSIIDTECTPLGSCEQVIQNLTTPSSPASLHFHSSGKTAFIAHWGNQTVSVIE